MCTIATAKVQLNYNCYNVYSVECLRSVSMGEIDFKDISPPSDCHTAGMKSVFNFVQSA